MHTARTVHRAQTLSLSSNGRNANAKNRKSKRLVFHMFLFSIHKVENVVFLDVQGVE